MREKFNLPFFIHPFLDFLWIFRNTLFIFVRYNTVKYNKKIKRIGETYAHSGSN